LCHTSRPPFALPIPKRALFSVWANLPRRLPKRRTHLLFPAAGSRPPPDPRPPDFHASGPPPDVQSRFANLAHGLLSEFSCRFRHLPLTVRSSCVCKRVGDIEVELRPRDATPNSPQSGY